jgi:hypothetical protein
LLRLARPDVNARGKLALHRSMLREYALLQP